MDDSTTNAIWVFGDLRSPHLLELSLKVLAKAAGLAGETGDHTILFLLSPSEDPQLTGADDAACALQGPLAADAFAWGADQVLVLTHPRFSTPTVHQFATVLTPVIRNRSPRLVLFPLTDFGRDLAARTAAVLGGGLMADCAALKPAADGSIVGLCPAWGGEVMAEITYATDRRTGFATVQPQGAPAPSGIRTDGSVETLVIPDVVVDPRIRLLDSRPARPADDDLENAACVVVGGAGLGSMDNFGQIRELAAALTGQVAATRPPVLNHWVAEDRLIGQTGKSVHPRLLFSVGTSGAVQYTAGITEAETIVAVNRDPSAPIFRLADVGVVADAATFLPLLTRRIQETVMRRLADDICAQSSRPAAPSGFGEKIKALRTAKGWQREQLAEATGQTPEFIAGVEAGEISPPVAFLLRLSSAYQIDPGSFLRDEEKAHIRDLRERAYVNRTRNYSYESLTSGAAHDHLRAFMVTIEPHHDHKPVAYKHDGEEFIFVMDGELQFTLGSKVQTLKKGESIHFHSSTPHKLKSLSAEITRCLVILYTL